MGEFKKRLWEREVFLDTLQRKSIPIKAVLEIIEEVKKAFPEVKPWKTGKIIRGQFVRGDPMGFDYYDKKEIEDWLEKWFGKGE